MKVTVLGCGSASPSPRHMPSCQVVEYRGRVMMIDCGEGAQVQMMRYGIRSARLTDIFISHLHGDHCLGLPGLLSTLALHHKGGTITVHTFADGAELLSSIVDFFCRERTFDLKFNIIDPSKPQTILEASGLVVSSFPLRHRVPTVGFRFTEAPKPRHIRGEEVRFFQVPVSQIEAIRQGADFVTPDGRVIENSRLTSDADPSRSYAYCSDTIYLPSIIPHIAGVDLLYHEATYTSESRAKAHERFHSTADEAATIARDAAVGQLMLGHYSKSYTDEELHLAEARAIFPSTIAAREGLTISL